MADYHFVEVKMTLKEREKARHEKMAMFCRTGNDIKRTKEYLTWRDGIIYCD